MASTKGTTVKSGTIRKRKGTLPSGASYESTRGHFGNLAQSTYTKKDGATKKSVVRTREIGTSHGATGNTIVSKKGVTPGGRAYESVRHSGKDFRGNPISTGKNTTVATNNKSSTAGSRRGKFMKNTYDDGTSKKIKVAERTGSMRVVKKGPTKPR